MNKSVLILLFGILISILNFLYGFLINRSEIYEISSCDNSSVYCNYSPYKRIVLLLVDSLKYEFIDPNLKKTNYYNGHVDIIHEVIKKQPNNSIVSHFISDPPTTTLQRIKGLTTGSLPTFIDISSNFGSSQLLEDNIIGQWFKSGFDMKFAGDDTWTDLFPNRFNISESYGSFNIKDLDSVDRKVEDFFLKFLLKPSTGSNSRPEVIIGHMLGIDHCGHTFGKNHPQMERKLKELNQFIKKILTFIDKESIFIMFGDHGMTTSGDHGGDSQEETDAGLFIKSGKPLGLNKRFVSPDSAGLISQIDLVPTVAAMTGVAIPYSNLGIIQPQMLTSLTRAQFYIDMNIKQISRYIDSYEGKFGSLGFPQSVKEFLRNSRQIADLETKIKNLEQIKTHFQSRWAQFTFPLILSSLSSFLLFLITLGNNCLFKLKNQSDFNRQTVFKYIFYFSLSIFQFFLRDYYFLLGFFLVAILYEASVFCGKYSQFHWPVFDLTSMVMACIGGLNVLIAFSNSFIVSEDRIMQFFLSSILFAKTAQCVLFVVRESSLVKPKIFDRFSHQSKWSLSWHYRKLLIFALVAFAVGSGCLSLGLRFKICREEQRAWCTENADPNDRLLHASLFFIPVLVILHRLWLRHCGNLSSMDCNVLLVKFLLPFIGFCLLVLHSLQFSSDSSTFSKIADMVQLTFPRIIWTASLIMLSCIFFRPLLMFHRLPFQVNGSVDIPGLFRQLKYSQSGDKSVIVHGLATVYSSVILTGLLSTCLFVSVFLKPQFAIGIVSIIGILFCYSILLNLSLKIDEGNILNSLPKTEMAIFMVILTQFGFFATGHQTTISNIPWYSVFIGWKNEHSTQLIPAIMLNINLFSAQIVITLFGLLLPLLFLFISLGPARLFGNRPTNKTSDDSNTSITCGDFHLFKTDIEAHRFRRWIQTYYLHYLFCHSLVTFCVILSTSYSRRHLMAWKIFVPKMIYSVLNLVIAYFMTALSYLFTMRIHRFAVSWRCKNI